MRLGLLVAGCTTALSLLVASAALGAGNPLAGSESACPGGRDTTAPAAVQVRTMLCLVNYARGKQGLEPLRLSGELSAASSAKARDIQRCGVFEHDACGKSAAAAVRRRGYRGA
jgi:uncharacterized protein YkwD